MKPDSNGAPPGLLFSSEPTFLRLAAGSSRSDGVAQETSCDVGGQEARSRVEEGGRGCVKTCYPTVPLRLTPDYSTVAHRVLSQKSARLRYLNLIVQSRDGTLARLALNLGTKEASLVPATMVLKYAGRQALAPFLPGWRLAGIIIHRLSRRLHSGQADSRAKER